VLSNVSRVNVLSNVSRVNVLSSVFRVNVFRVNDNIVLNVKFHFAGELRGFANCVSVFRFVCRVLRK